MEIRGDVAAGNDVDCTLLLNVAENDHPQRQQLVPHLAAVALVRQSVAPGIQQLLRSGIIGTSPDYRRPNICD